MSNKYYIIVDGSAGANGNAYQIGAGMIVIDECGFIHHEEGFTAKHIQPTSMISELYAISKACEYILQQGNNNQQYYIFSDSEHVLKNLDTLSNTVKKSTFLKPFFEQQKRILAQMENVTLMHIRGFEGEEMQILHRRAHQLSRMYAGLSVQQEPILLNEVAATVEPITLVQSFHIAKANKKWTLYMDKVPVETGSIWGIIEKNILPLATKKQPFQVCDGIKKLLKDGTKNKQNQKIRDMSNRLLKII